MDKTKKIAEFMAQYLEGEVVVSLLTEELDLPFFDRVIIGASIRYGHLINSCTILWNATMIAECKKVRSFLA